MAVLSNRKKAKLEQIKSEFDELIESKGDDGITLQEALNAIKSVLEETIAELAEDGKTALIRSQKPIKIIHEVVKTSLINFGVNPNNIKPNLGASAGELKLAGFLKKKDQDICVVPNGITAIEETMTDGLLAGQQDEFGLALTGHTISINVRSQLSSLGNNIDTLYERTFAEALNLHMRCPSMCLGEVYMIPVYEYDKHEAQSKRVDWVNAMSPIETYIKAFSAINSRTNVADEFYKYERVCLLIVDFSEDIPKVYNTDAELKADGLIPNNSTASITHLNYNSFVAELMATYSARFPANTFN
ncbi:MAG: restriction endonuclease [Sphingobacteriales bacterium]|nr:restriction endonuclease [Sphingobacteriales bacterium]MBI3719364.1 restriction endonuclease [Sphingobacteriales bacterium]